MQTFLVSPNPVETAQILDRMRLGKQRVEAVQIANTLLGFSKKKGWANHPAVLMWKGHEYFLVNKYLYAMMFEWQKRGYKNEKCQQHYKKFNDFFNRRSKHFAESKPNWFCNEFFESHKSNLIRKNKEHYSQFWPEVPDNLEYWWPTKNGF